MSWSLVAMYVVAAVLVLTGIGLIAALARPASPGRVYAFRMVGIMALAGGAVLAMSATALWHGGDG
ncbi:hypothetical protein [Sphingomonas yantingensis]|uniref:Uncharacterized protein n=1 Tax=Sphingomonas yantingensis TaxID=1241761 RepID=A0A7W9AMA6_9SPHN|nr:hypothetical protein [Sphingomonas yantingensis]MBB5697089.1 hypothetical protein [Sphingomonas yantingensis]